MNIKDLPDYKHRLHLTQMIGLDEVPDLDPDAWDKLAGCLSDVFDGEVDAVELVKQVREPKYDSSKQTTKGVEDES